MPTTAKSTSKIATLGDLSTYSVSTNAMPTDTSDSSGSLPSVNATFVNGTNTEYLMGESLTLASPTIGSYTGGISSYSKSRKSAQFSLTADSILSRMNVDLRTYPLSDYSTGTESTVLPIYTLEYWTQQCGIFNTAVPGDVLFYQSLFGHFGAFAKNITKPVRAKRGVPVSGGSVAQTITVGNAVYTGLGRGFTATTDFPPPASGTIGGYLPVQIPSNTSQTLTLGADVALTTSTNSGSISWSMVDPKGGANPVTLLASAASGFQLQIMVSGKLTTILTAPAANNATYSVYIGLNNGAAGMVKASMRVVNSAGVVVSDLSKLVTSGLTGNQSLQRVTYTGNLGGTGTEIYVGNVFVANMPALPVGLLPAQKSLTAGYKGSIAMVGFSGNVWEHVKAFCSVYHLDLGYQNGKLTVAPRPADVTVGSNLSELSTTITARDEARNVQVINQNHKPTGTTPTVFWKADSVYQVAVGETQTFTVQTPHSILELSQPVCVSGINPYPYTAGSGQYVVTGSDGYIVSPQFWSDQGGSITVATTANEGEISVTIQGPAFDSARAPYRISEGDAGRPALYVTGLGVLATPETLTVGTGNGGAAKDVGVTLDSPFLSTKKLAYDAAARAGKLYSSPEVSVSIAEPLDYDQVSTLGSYPVGSIVKHEGSAFRVKSAEQKYSLVTGSTEQHNTIYQVTRSFGATTTIAQQNAFYAGKTIGQVNIKPLKRLT